MVFAGKTPYKRIGCYKDKGASQSRPLPELLFDVSSNASQLIGSQWNHYLLEIVCKCAEEAKLRKYTHFGVQDFGKCYSGSNVRKTFDKVLDFYSVANSANATLNPVKYLPLRKFFLFKRHHSFT